MVPWPYACTHARVQAEKGRGAMGNMINVMKVIISNPLDLQPLRATYSFDLCGLIASMVAKERVYVRMYMYMYVCMCVCIVCICRWSPRSAAAATRSASSS